MKNINFFSIWEADLSIAAQRTINWIIKTFALGHLKWVATFRRLSRGSRIYGVMIA